MAIDAVIFDWGGTLTPWHDVSLGEMWRELCAAHLPAGEVERAAVALLDAEDELWRRCRDEHRSGTLDEIFALAGVAASETLLAAWYEAWTPHTYTDPHAFPLLRALRERGIKVGVLSNTTWSRAWHERIFARDGVLELLDGAVYSSEIPWTKPHADAFRAAMDAVGADDPAACVFVGDRPYDDIHGAQSAGLRAVLLPNGSVPPHDVVPDAVISGLDELLPHIDRWSDGR
ncbi:HAD family hydrolase [Actinomadura parmotrematis]|uniref:HAD family hydrolase n=1 Tax=Actinomadura parmotrematis TaxID=2864039 RepID=A0ABS7FVG1_9ACTN|nr:HAD family hydrolase [Actinomadura parmotrematis]MBW8483669.1 HAD family hydrolase [Actinomadura parmotrematis]